MLLRILIGLAIAAAFVAGSLAPGLGPNLRALIAGPPPQDSAARGPDTNRTENRGEAAGLIRMTAEQIDAAGIEIAPVGSGTLARRLILPGTIRPDADRVAHVAAKVVGTVAELGKRLGDEVSAGEVIAALDSREVADAKSEYVAAQVNAELQKTLFEREQGLAQARVVSENQFLRTRTTYTEAQLRHDLARQKLLALGVGAAEIAALTRESAKGLQRYEIHAPIAGRVVERFVDLGAPVGGEGQAKELYVIADLSTVWIELAAPPADIAALHAGQRVTVTAGAMTGEGRVAFISPMLNTETRSARVIATLGNAALAWRPGSYVSATIAVDEQPARLIVPRSALQSSAGRTMAFVRTADGFERRAVVVGRSDDEAVEIVSGLAAGERIAVANAFVLKAELGKAEAEAAP